MIENLKRLSTAFVVAGVPSLGMTDFANACPTVKTSWYSVADSSTKTASGERMRDSALTAAHPTLPFGTELRVTNKRNGKSVVVRVNDRGPAAWTGKGLDLSKAAANQLGFINAGWTHVSMCRL